MEVITNHFIETHFVCNPEDTGKDFVVSVTPIKERNPLLITNEHSAKRGFRFFDVITVVLDDGEELKGKPKNYSNMIYFGERKLPVDLLSNPDYRNVFSFSMVKSLVFPVIVCDCGCIVTDLNPDDKTLSELKDKSFVKALGEQKQTK